MDFNFNPEDEAFRMEFREWLKANKQFAPNMGETTIGMAEGRGEFDQQKKWAKKMAEGRWLAPSWPKQYGGRGAGILQNIVYGEELARAGVSAPMIGMGISLFGPTLLHWGTEEQKQRFIPPIMKAEEIWCQGYSEPG
jgi:alkylation response protein AidB-like acyl-CoA dehydrogenase